MGESQKYTEQLADEGIRLLNFWRMADNERDHVDCMLEMLNPGQGDAIVDLGSGTGEFARIATQIRPDLMFTLVNNDEWQASQSPSSARVVQADMADTGLESESADVVILAYALGHGDVVDVLEEAHRLLKPGGKLLLHDVFAWNHVDAEAFRSRLNYAAHNPDLLKFWTNLIGFDFVTEASDPHLACSPTVDSVRDVLDRMAHGVMAFEKSARKHKFHGRKAALQFSGGKDSMACLVALKPFLAKYIDVYRLDTGDAIPETVEVVDAVRASIPRLIEIRTDVAAWRNTHGMPSDLVPARSHEIGMMYAMSNTRISNRFDCCAANLMMPMHNRMIADGIDLIIRGTKESDTGKIPFQGTQDGIEVWLPVADFSHDDVFALLRDAGATISTVYEYATGISAPECFGCTAWWDDKKAAYLKAIHPEQYEQYRTSLTAIAAEVTKSLADLYSEIS